MKAKEFDALLKSIDEARAIKAGRRKPSRVITFSPVEVKTIRKRLRVSQIQFAHLMAAAPPPSGTGSKDAPTRKRPRGPFSKSPPIVRTRSWRRSAPEASATRACSKGRRSGSE